MKQIRVGISTCPNDTFAFFPLLEKLIDTGDLDLQFQLLDVQQLNEKLVDDQLDVAKASFHAALTEADNWSVFRSGSALGFGNGPLLLAATESRPEAWPPQSSVEDRRETPIVLCPGALTTATMLYRLFYSNCGTVDHVVFSEIMPALEQGTADFGVCIHEGRFTYQQQGLYCVEDLGKRWEKETGKPLPLGGILGANRLGDTVLQQINQLISQSVDYALEHRDQAMATMKKYAQELDEDVIWQHVDLYVNDWTVDLGTVGQEALQELSRRAESVGLVKDKTLTIV